MVDFAVDEEVERSPDDSEIVIDADKRVVNALFDLGGWLRGAGAADAVGEGVGSHLAGGAIAHENHGCARDEGGFDGCGVTLSHAVEHCVDGSEDSFFFGRLGRKRGSRREKQREKAECFHGC